MNGLGFHHVAIRAIDFDATIKFYNEGLGCTVSSRCLAGSTVRPFSMQATAGSSRCSAQRPPSRRRDDDAGQTRKRPREHYCTFACGCRMWRRPMRVPSRPVRPRELRRELRALPASPQPRCTLLSSLDRMAKSSSF